jgi:hypothetical protein
VSEVREDEVRGNEGCESVREEKLEGAVTTDRQIAPAMPHPAHARKNQSKETNSIN